MTGYPTDVHEQHPGIWNADHYSPRYYFACQGCGACGPLRRCACTARGDEALHNAWHEAIRQQLRDGTLRA